jgi:hypothetical protein
MSVLLTASSIIYLGGFAVSMTVATKNTVFWDVTWYRVKQTDAVDIDSPTSW